MKNRYSPYKDQVIAFATMHKKELYLNPACRKILGASLCTFDEKINTDLLGTFSGEIERKKNQKETVIEKCQLGMAISGMDLGMASEGSFGPHPYVPFIISSCEALVFYDSKRNLQVFESMIFTKSNYQSTTCNQSDDLTKFLKDSLFPSHGLIVRPNLWFDKKIIFKGVQDFFELKKYIEFCCRNSTDQMAYIETDMRAHKNPTRGYNIRKLGIRLFRRLTRLCPVCQSPGWGKTGIKRGKPCSICEYPTELPIGHIWSCPVCPYKEEELLSDPLQFADPQHCNMCNP